MAEHGICGRAVLVDHLSYTRKHGKSFNFMDRRSIPVSEIKTAAVEQGTSFHPGDILFIRSGFTAMYESLNDEEKVSIATSNPPSFSGAETGSEFARWVWERQFSAVAGDAPAFEAWRKYTIV